MEEGHSNYLKTKSEKIFGINREWLSSLVGDLSKTGGALGSDAVLTYILGKTATVYIKTFNTMGTYRSAAMDELADAPYSATEKQIRANLYAGSHAVVAYFENLLLSKFSASVKDEVVKSGNASPAVGAVVGGFLGAVTTIADTVADAIDSKTATNVLGVRDHKSDLDEEEYSKNFFQKLIINVVSGAVYGAAWGYNQQTNTNSMGSEDIDGIGMGTKTQNLIDGAMGKIESAKTWFDKATGSYFLQSGKSYTAANHKNNNSEPSHHSGTSHR